MTLWHKQSDQYPSPLMGAIWVMLFRMWLGLIYGALSLLVFGAAVMWGRWYGVL